MQYIGRLQPQNFCPAKISGYTVCCCSFQDPNLMHLLWHLLLEICHQFDQVASSLALYYKSSSPMDHVKVYTLFHAEQLIIVYALMPLPILKRIKIT